MAIQYTSALDNLINPDDHECLDDDLELNNLNDDKENTENQYIDLFIPSVHDANKFFNQQTWFANKIKCFLP